MEAKPKTHFGQAPGEVKNLAGGHQPHHSQMQEAPAPPSSLAIALSVLRSRLSSLAGQLAKGQIQAAEHDRAVEQIWQDFQRKTDQRIPDPSNPSTPH